MHVHVGLDDPDKAIHVVNGMRVHMPVLLALSANSPFWRGGRDRAGFDPDADLPRLSARRDAARRTGTGRDYERRIEFMVGSGAIEDYTYLWYDVRPHPDFGTVEVRVMDSQTHIEHTLGLAAFVQALVRELSDHFESGGHLAEYPFEMLEENKWLAARHGLDGELVDLPSADRVPTRELARRLLDRMRELAQDIGLRRRARWRRGPARARQRRRSPARRPRGEPRPPRGDGGDRRGDGGLAGAAASGRSGVVAGRLRRPCRPPPGRLYNRPL